MILSRSPDHSTHTPSSTTIILYAERSLPDWPSQWTLVTINYDLINNYCIKSGKIPCFSGQSLVKEGHHSAVVFSGESCVQTA